MRKQHKGTTVVEVVIAFAMVSMSFAIGMIGIASGSNFINSGARLKNQQRKTAAADLDGERCIGVGRYHYRNRKRRHDNDV